MEKVFKRIEHLKDLDDPSVRKGDITRDGEFDDAYSTSNDGVLGGVHVGGNLQFNAAHHPGPILETFIMIGARCCAVWAGKGLPRTQTVLPTQSCRAVH